MGRDGSKARGTAREKALCSFLEQMETRAPRNVAPASSPATRATGNGREIVQTPGRAAARAERRTSSHSAPAGVARAPVAAPRDFAETLLDGKYRVGRLRGRGGVGEVYEAVHAVIGMRVAIKLIRKEWAGDGELSARFLQEARAAAAVGHPGIVHVHDVGTTPEGRTYLVMELLEGEDLEKVLRRRTQLPPAEIVPILCDTLEALDAAHSKGIVHRDMKPENIFLVAGPRGGTAIRILDFGIARLAATPGTASRLTVPGTVMGTPFYMSPEQVAGTAAIDGGADIYALGVVLFEALTGKLPFAGANVQETLCKVLEAPFPSARELCPEIPEELERVIRRATARARGERFHDAASFAAALEPFRELRFSAAPGAAPGTAARHRQASDATPQPVIVSHTAPTVAVRGATGPVAAPPAAVSHSDGGAGRRRRSRLAALAAGVVLVAGIALALLLTRDGGNGSRDPAAVREAASGDESVRVRIRGVPAGAVLRFDGRVVGTDFTVPAGAVLHELEVAIPGRAPLVRAVRAAADVTVDLGLVEPVPAATPPGAGRRPPP
ncbi:MAG: serine/threonine protein kinase [Deltaproteobacteria bacterium]|nr:serine/threonine protein kinase [Deltaproteobacteria bacterium]